jgi:hypothetical protein
MDTLTTYAQYASYVIAGLIVILNAIAPLVKSKWDNKAVAVLTWIHDVALKLLLPQHDTAVKQPDPTPSPATPPSA